MLFTIFFLVYFLAILNTKRKKPLKLITLSLFVLLIIVMGGVANNPDYLNYQYIYEYNVPGLEYGFSVLMNISHMVGFSYNFFRLIIIIMSLSMIRLFLNKLEIKNDIYWLMYIPYLMILDSIQIRNF